MKTIIKITLTYLIACVVILPLFAIFNENDNLWVNLGGFAYFGILWIIGQTKAGKKGLKCLIRANYELTKIIGL